VYVIETFILEFSLKSQRKYLPSPQWIITLDGHRFTHWAIKRGTQII